MTRDSTSTRDSETVRIYLAVLLKWIHDVNPHVYMCNVASKSALPSVSFLSSYVAEKTFATIQLSQLHCIPMFSTVHFSILNSYLHVDFNNIPLNLRYLSYFCSEFTIAYVIFINSQCIPNFLRISHSKFISLNSIIPITLKRLCIIILKVILWPTF